MVDMNFLLQSVSDGSTGPGQPTRGFAALDHALRQYPGHRLFTILSIDRDRQVHRRIYTSAPDAYPCGGSKPLHRDKEFFQRVVAGRFSRICRDAHECRAAFSDFELIQRLGCESAVNVPIVAGGLTVGSMNLLHEQGWYTQDMLQGLEEFAALAARLMYPLSKPQPH